MKRKLIEKYFAELPENEHTRIGVINYIKVMIKNIHFNQMTASSEEQDSIEEQVLMDWILENEPQIIVEISKFWVYNSFSLSSNDD